MTFILMMEMVTSMIECCLYLRVVLSLLCRYSM